MLFTSGSNSQALKAILSQYASQSNRLSMLQKKESPLGAAIKLPWTRHRGGVLNAGKTTSSGNSSDEVHSKHSVGGNTCVTSFKRQSSFLFLQKGLDSGCQEYKEPSPYFSEFC